jgi:putative glutamine amidotransferase
MDRHSPIVPRIVVTASVASHQAEPELAARKTDLYVAAMTRQGAEVLVLDPGSTAGERADAFARMDGLLLSGGADIDPARYDRPIRGATSIEPGRDALEAAAWTAASERSLPVLGLCRGFQAINVFSGGTLIQHVDGHAGPPWGHGPAKTHPLRIEPGTRLARILFPTNVRGGVVDVNTYHHQAIGPGDLAPSLVPNARASSPAGELVEGLETRDGRFVIGVQCHPERTESTPAAFERLFAIFVDAARGPARDR